MHSRKREPTETQRLLTISQVSSVCGVPSRSVYDQIARGSLPIVRFPGSRRIWIDRHDIESLIERSKETVNA